jgi:hypothetical protein
MAEKRNSTFIQNYELYKRIRFSKKTIGTNKIVLIENPNHKVGNEKIEKLTHSELNDLNLSVRADKILQCRYQFHIKSRTICDEPFFRFDAAGATHRNRTPDTPLFLQRVETPHFQNYDKNGYSFAYQTEELKDKKILELLEKDINLGIELFCKESIIFTTDNELPRIFRDSGILFSAEQIDPLEDTKFI